MASHDRNGAVFRLVGQRMINKCGAFIGATSKPPPIAKISQLGKFFTGEEISGIPVVRLSLYCCGRASPPASARARTSANGRQLRVGDIIIIIITTTTIKLSGALQLTYIQSCHKH